MFEYILKRFLIMIPTVIIISIISFWVIQLPPGDFVSTYAAQAAQEGEVLDTAELREMREVYGLNDSFFTQYRKWISGIIFRGDFGFSFQWNKKVSDLIMSRMGLTLMVSLTTMLFTYLVSIPIGIYGATHQYSFGDYLTAFIGFIGTATPNFLLAIICMYFAFRYFGSPMMGLFSPEFAHAPWSIAKFFDLMKHMIIPIVVIGTAGTCGLIRVMRGQLLDEIKKQYVITARAKGVGEKTLLYKYPVRASLNPIVSTIGWSLTAIFSGSTITAIVLNLPTQGPLLYGALLSQDMYLAGGLLFILTTLTVIGTLLSDVLLAWLDPRIRLGKDEA